MIVFIIHPGNAVCRFALLFKVCMVSAPDGEENSIFSHLAETKINRDLKSSFVKTFNCQLRFISSISCSALGARADCSLVSNVPLLLATRGRLETRVCEQSDTNN